MAITGAQLQAELGTNPLNATVLREFGTQGTLQGWCVAGNLDAPGRVRLIETTASDSAANQATAVLAALRA
jgi:hypothetical protein